MFVSWIIRSGGIENAGSRIICRQIDWKARKKGSKTATTGSGVDPTAIVLCAGSHGRTAAALFAIEDRTRDRNGRSPAFFVRGVAKKQAMRFVALHVRQSVPIFSSPFPCAEVTFCVARFFLLCRQHEGLTREVPTAPFPACWPDPFR